MVAQPASAAVLGSLTAVSAAGAESLTVTVTPDVPAATDVTASPAYIVSADGPDAGSTADQTCNVNTVLGGSCTLTGLVAGTTYTVTADPQGATVLADVTATGVTLPTLSPTGTPVPTATGVSGEINVAFTGVANTLATIANYTATAYLGGASTAKTCTTTTNALSNSCKIGGLTNGTEYTFKVVANGASGIANSAASAASAAVAPAVTPAAPTDVTARATTTTNVLVSWTAPTAVDGQTFTYTVAPKTAGGSAAGGVTCTVVGTTTTANCTPVSVDTGYYFTVTATSSGLTSSAAQSSVIIPTTPPNAVTSVTGTVGDTQSEVSWTAPVAGATVASYKATALEGGVETAHTCTTPATATKCTITGLTNGTAYTFSVVAVGSAGFGPDSTAAVSGPVTPVEAPKPTAPVVTPPTDDDVSATSAVISWTPADNPTTPVLYFVATAVAKTPAAAAAEDLSCTTTGSSCKISGLVAGTEYDVTVLAHSANSVSVAATTSITTDAAAPGTAGAMTGPIVTNSDGLSQIFARGGDNFLYTSIQAANGTWGAWTNLSGLIYSDPTAVKNANGRITVFAIGGDHSIWYRLQNGDGSFAWWTRLGTERYASDIEVAQNADGTVAVFIKGMDDNLYSQVQTDPADPSQWSGWTNLGGLIYSNPTAFTRADGVMEVFAVGGDGLVWHRVQSAPNSGTWAWWAHVA
ncbi:fibronectin type III domain-containing protein [Dactylosporangium sp. NBC_01737]|uniref:fibronectin type III domain-containing protein n=1 Tax=Dactylosporangium sp. NBC_01737 TaxID=2975959 RepID=UPI002E14E526|nr:fibronectin type III domain-containing protein [Dactylosporangium sp. NBC_01737]